MGTNARGHQFWAQFGKESAYATPVAATGFRHWCYDASFEGTPGIVRDEGFVGSMETREHYRTTKQWAIEFTTDLLYTGVLKFIDMLMGTQASGPATPTITGPDGNGLYTVTYKWGLTPNSYTIEVMKGLVGGIATVTQYAGFVAEKIVIKMKAGTSEEGRARITVSGIAAKRATGVTAAALSLPTVRGVHFHHATTVDNGTADAAADTVPKELQIEIVGPLDKSRWAISTQDYTLLPLRNGPPVVTWTIKQEYQTETAETAFHANTDGSPRFMFTSPTIVVAAYRTVDISSGKCRLVKDPTAKPDAWGALHETLVWESIADSGASSGIVLVHVVTEATIAAG